MIDEPFYIRSSCPRFILAYTERSCKLLSTMLQQSFQGSKRDLPMAMIVEPKDPSEHLSW